MTEQVKAAAIYTRISSDQEGTGLGVARQEQDCRELAARLGWPVAGVYQDNDVSAFSKRPRPAYQRMLRDLRAGRLDAVLVYHLDRLVRRPIDLEEFNQVLDDAGVSSVQFVSGHSEISTDHGLFVLRSLGNFAALESAAKSRRLKRKYQQMAEMGLPSMGGTNRAFGYLNDRVTIDEDEAAVIRTLVARFLAGESWRSLTAWLQEQDIRTPTGGQWGSTRVRTMLLSPRLAGLREHNGVVVGPAVWPGIITVEERDRMLALVAQRKATGRRSPRRYLLSGMLRCSKCGGKMFAAARAEGRRYVCRSGPDHGGCGKSMIQAEPVEQLVTAGVLHRLASPALTQAMTGRARDDQQAERLAREIDADQEQLNELAGMFADKAITSAEWRTARDRIDTRLRHARRPLIDLTHTDSLEGLDLAGDLHAQFAELELERQHAIIGAVLDHVVILPGTPGARSVDPARVEPVWRL